MCGIGLFINYSSKLINLQDVFETWGLLSKRGTDASGIYYERKEGSVTVQRILKAPQESRNLLKIIQQKQKDWSYASLNGKEKIIILHTRSKTQGTEFSNRNNMPISSENYILVHNGIISNKKINNYKYKAEVDSEEILAHIETKGITKGLGAIDGSVACIIKPKKENFIYIYRNSNPFTLAFLAEEKILIGASEHDFIPMKKEYLMLTKSLFKPKVTMISPRKDTLYKINILSPECDIVSDIKENMEKN